MPTKRTEVVDNVNTESAVATMVELCQVVPDHLTCADVDASFSAGWESSSILVRGADGAIGILGRSSFLATMAGRFGYGRSLWGKQPVGAVTTWGVPLVRPTTTIAQAAALIVDSAEGFRDLPAVDADGEPLGIVRPLRVMRALAEQTAHRAATDQLTGVASRARFIEELTARVAALGEQPGAVVVAFLDLDRLKPVNDLFGHTLGDALLKSVAKRLKGAVGDHDVVGRLGGDEFAVVTVLEPGTQGELESQALAMGERLRSALARRDHALPKKAESRASVGVTFTSEALADAEPLLVSADEAMYAAKLAGGDRVRLGGSMGTARRCVPTEDLFLVYQPVVDVRSGRVTAVEALLRTRAADGTAAFPAARMQQAVRSGSTLALDRWIVALACADMVRWEAEGALQLPPKVHINLAPQTVCTPDFAALLLADIDESGIARDRVCLELSEYAGVEDLVRATPQLAALADAGVHLALDDMGATLGALRLLGTALPIECIKVDRSIIEGCGNGRPFDVEILDMVTRLAERFDIEVVAEGVETVREHVAVRRSGIHQIQGFLHGKPLAEADLLPYLERSKDGHVVPQPVA